MKTNITLQAREEAINKMKAIAGNNPVCLFTTTLGEAPLRMRPMYVQRVCDQGNFWFLSTAGSSENNEIDTDPAVQLFFGNSHDSEFLSVYGKATIVLDREKIAEIWNPLSGRWFSKDKDDPNTTILKVTPLQAYEWDLTKERMSLLWENSDALDSPNSKPKKSGTSAPPENSQRAVVFKWAHR